VWEFWSTFSHPTDRNGLGISIVGTERHTRLLERYEQNTFNPLKRFPVAQEFRTLSGQRDPND
jgi:hypothetical protein